MRLPASLRRRLAKAITDRLSSEPRHYGHPLRASLSGCWKLRVGDYRVVYRIEAREVWILAILHRRLAYPEAEQRREWSP